MYGVLGSQALCLFCWRRRVDRTLRQPRPWELGSCSPGQSPQAARREEEPGSSRKAQPQLRGACPSQTRTVTAGLALAPGTATPVLSQDVRKTVAGARDLRVTVALTAHFLQFSIAEEFRTPAAVYGPVSSVWLMWTCERG